MRPAPLHTELINRLGTEIVNGTLGPGAAFTLEAISQRFGVSRTVSREAIQSLELMQLVKSRRKVGIVVQPSDSWNVLNPLVIAWRLAGPDRGEQLRTLTELRLGIEPTAAAAAARCIDGKTANQLVKVAHEMQALGIAGKIDKFIELDNTFHEMILRGSSNEMFAALSDPILAVISGRSHIGLMPDHPVTEAIELHIQIAQAIQAREPALAEASMRQLLAEVRSAVHPSAASGASSSR